MADEQEKVRIACEGAATVDLDALLDFQGSIKKLSDENAAKLRRQIEEHGVTAPVFVWRTGGKNPKHYILDGHQRTTVLRTMREEGWTVPEIPVVYIDAKSKKDAASKLLAISSQYGTFDVEALEAWASSINLSLPDLDLRLVDFSLDLSATDIDIDDLFKDHTGEDADSSENAGGKTVCPNCGHVFDA